MNEKKNLTIIEDIIILYKSGKLDEAKSKIENCIKKFPKPFVLHNVLGAIFSDQGKLEEAVKQHKKAIEINPSYAEGYNNLGIAFQKLKQFNEAVTNYKKALKLKPDFATGYNNLAGALKNLNKLDEALINCKKAIELKPDFADAHNNLGSVLKDLNHLEQSKECFEKAIELKPDYVEAYDNLGIVLKKFGKLEESIEKYQKLLEINPGYYQAYSNYLFALLYLTKYDHKHYTEVAKKFRHNLKKIESKLCTSYQYNKNPKKLKIGFVSGDFKIHPVGYFLLDTLSYLKNKNLYLIAYSNSLNKDSLSDKLKSNFNEWREIADLGDVEVINQIREDGIHILFDLSGHSANNRLPIFINKPAPLQISWVGYAASTGIPEIDYIIGDSHVTPVESKEHFVEKILRLPNIWCSFSKPDFKIEKTETIPALKNGFITFGCFNNLHKLNEKVINTWAKILNTVSDSKLILKNGMFEHTYFKEKIIYLFKKHRINVNKLILEEGSQRKELLETYNKIDISLDPFPYSGGTTSFESIWMEVPVLTKKGFTFVSRTTESINHNCGLSDWVAAHENEYIAKAIEFSSNLELLSKTKKNLRQGARNFPFFDTFLFAEHFNNNMWQIWNEHINKNN